MSKLFWSLALPALVTFGCGGPARAQEYMVGGPLQGVELPLMPTQHGEKPGYPGCVPALQKPEIQGNSPTMPFTSQGLPPERQLYEGSVEHFRAYWFKYVPVKSFFDRQSLIKNWRATELAPGQAEDYPEPVYWVPRHAEIRFTGLYNKPVKVVRAKIGTPLFQLDCGTLEPGMYAIRAIGAVETKNLQRHRKPLILKLLVDNGLKREQSVSRYRCKYVDEFYAVAEFYFNAPEKRAYQATLSVDTGSMLDLMLYNIDLHDALAGTSRQPIKTRVTLTPGVTPEKMAVNDDQRLAVEEALWQSLPPINAQNGWVYGGGGDDAKTNQPNLGAAGMTPQQIGEQSGNWMTAPVSPVLMVNKKLGLEFSIADLAAGKALPAPYPFPDNGTGVFTPPAKAEENPQNWFPVANACRDRRSAYLAEIQAKTQAYRQKADVEAGRTAAFMLCRYAYDYPAMDNSNALSSVVLQPGPYGRDLGCRRRDPSIGGSSGYADLYDSLFNLVRADEGLAQSLGRFIPWVKTPQDVIKLLDCYLVQTPAKRLLRYQWLYDNRPTMILPSIIALGDNKVTSPWMQWLFTSAYTYPLPPAGLPDLLVTGNDRNGIGYIGSYSYALGEQAAPTAANLEQYLAIGGLPEYDLRDPKRYPKPIAACYWYLDTRMAGLYFPRVGDVAGPDKYYAAWMNTMPQQCLRGWRWTKDPRFAYVVARDLKGSRDISDAEWAEINAAAAKQPRAPWLENRSRVLTNWLALLEAGVEHDDIRFRRDVYLHVGMGLGHQHSDTLDLQGHMHGYPFTIDGGQRGGYSRPGDAKTRVHNLVEVDGADWRGHSWVKTLSDMEGARYLMAEAVAPANVPQVKLYRRQVSLVDVDAGQAGEPGGAAEKLPKATTPNSYVFDVVRVSGGKQHTYCFHGPIEDELVTNAQHVERGLDKVTSVAEKELLARFPMPERASAGDAPPIVEATWRMTRAKEYGNEEGMNPLAWDPASPRKYTRLHVLDQQGARVLTGALFCHQWKYAFTNVYVQRTAPADADAVFPALIEPYVGTPFIAGCKTLAVADNEADAQRAVALEVRTTGGNTDICFADGRPERTRAVGAMRFAAEYAYYSCDSNGLRQASLAGGTLLAGPQVTIKVARPQRAGKVTSADYLNRTLTLDTAWPEAALVANRVFEIGVPGRMTSYTLARAHVAGDGTQLDLTEGAAFYLSQVVAVDTAARQVQCVLAPSNVRKENPRPIPGQDKQWVASNEAGTKFWRAEFRGQDPDSGYYVFGLSDAVTESDFGKMGKFRLWECGVGDTARMATFASLRRVGDNRYQLAADTDVEIAFAGGPARTVTAAELASSGGAVTLRGQ